MSGRGKCPGNMSEGGMSRRKCPDPDAATHGVSLEVSECLAQPHDIGDTDSGVLSLVLYARCQTV